MLKKIRIILAAAFFLLITLLFLDFTGTIHLWLGWMAKVQLIPAILTVNIVVIISLILLTLIFGRVYCSVICPLGVLQDGISNIAGRRKGKKNRFSYSQPSIWLRYGLLVIFAAAMITGVSAIVSVLDPYAAYGRMASNLFSPIYRLGNNLLALIAEQADSYMFYSTEVWIKGWITFGVAAITLIIIGVLAWRHGRTYCNTICPVGTVLGFVSRFAILKPIINTSACNKCGLCAKNCKASCIDSKTHFIDYSRCVTCMNCLDVCHSNAITYSFSPIKRKNGEDKTEKNQQEQSSDASRRSFLSIATLFTVSAAVKAQQLHVDGGLAEIEDKKIPDRKTPIVPPGASGAKNMKDHCTACQLCVSACPNNILRPSDKLLTFMQPEMSFERGYCRPECTECSQVCPTAAIKPITTADKSGIAIGFAVWITENCVVNRDEVQCNSCEQHCPTKAITMIDRDPGDSDSLKIPTINKELCIGCGACEYQCPARPFSAIYVEGNVRHHSV